MTEFEKRLLDGYQRDLPLTPRPYAGIAEELGVSEAEVIAALRRLAAEGVISRVGAVLEPGSVGASTLAAMAVPDDRLAGIAELVNGYPEVNHNYQREHPFNLWFVIIAGDEDGVARVIDDIERRTGLEVLDLPMLEGYHLDLGFPLQWN